MDWFDFHIALATLGIGPDTTRQEARRAYLRLIKVHKPEQDPEGFQRIRSAYERVRNALPEGRVAAPAHDFVPTPLSDFFEPDRPVEPEAVELIEPEAAEPPTVELIEPEAAEPPTVELNDANALATIEPEAAEPPAIEPVEPEPVQPLDLAEADPNSSAGTPAHSFRVGAQEPSGEPNPLALHSEFERGNFCTLFAVATELADFAGAARCLEAFVEWAAPRNKWLPLQAILNGVFLMHEADALDAAHRCTRACVVALEATGAELKLQPTVAVSWSIARELAALSSTFASEIRRLIAEAARREDPGAAFDEVSKYAAENVFVAALSRDELVRVAPNLHALLGGAFIVSVDTARLAGSLFRRQAPDFDYSKYFYAPKAKRKSTLSQFLGVVAVVVPLLLAFVFSGKSGPSSPPSPYYAPPIQIQTPTIDYRQFQIPTFQPIDFEKLNTPPPYVPATPPDLSGYPVEIDREALMRQMKPIPPPIYEAPAKPSRLPLVPPVPSTPLPSTNQ